MPKFLFEKENQILVLLMLLVIVVIVPCGIVLWTRSTSGQNRHGINEQNIQIYISLIHDSLNIKQLLYMISLSFEFRNLRISKDQEKKLNELKSYLSYIPSGKQASPQMIKVIFLILAHLDRVPLPSELKNDQQKILNITTNILSTMIETAFMMSLVRKGKKIGISTYDLILDLNRRIIHAVPFQNNCAYMINGLSDYKALAKFGSIRELREIACMGSAKIDKKDIETISKSVQEFPEYAVEASIYTDAESDIRIGDIATLKIKIINKNAKNGGISAVNSPWIEFKKNEKIWIFASDAKKVIFVKAINMVGPVTEDDSIKIPLERDLGFSVGKQSLNIEIKSDSYLGADSDTRIDFNILNKIKAN